MNMLKISKAIFRSLLSSRSLCVVVVALMVLCALPVFRSAAGIDGRVEYLESGITRVEQELSASYADALVNAGEDGVYTSSSSMPALLYPLAAGRLILAPLSPLLPFLQISDGEYTYYDGSKEYLLWVATAVAVSFLAARLNKREKLIIQAPMGELGRLVASSVWASVFAMLAVLAINLPGIIAALCEEWPGLAVLSDRLHSICDSGYQTGLAGVRADGHLAILGGSVHLACRSPCREDCQ